VNSIVLIRPAYSHFIYGRVYDPNEITQREVRPPLGLMALAAYLKKRGHTVKILDAEPEMLSPDEVVRRVLNERPSIVGLTATTPEYPETKRILSALKSANDDIITVLGGAHISSLPEFTASDLGSTLTWGVIGEGEIPFAAIAEARALDFQWTHSGTSNILIADKRLDAQALDAHIPDREVLDMSVYKTIANGVGLAPCDGVETARGCCFSCAFCTSRQTKMVKRSLDSVISEIVLSYERLRTRTFIFFDDTLTADRARTMDLCQRILALKQTGKIEATTSFSGYTRADRVDLELLRLMRDAGFDRISIGVESGDPDLLRAVEKGITHEQIVNAFALMDELEICKRASFIIGHPFETEETIRRSIEFAKSLDLDECGVNIMTPYPGQPLFRQALAGRGLWFAHAFHYPELRGHTPIDWDSYWEEHLRWGGALVETETLSADALVYWHGRFLQEVYGTDAMARRRAAHIAEGNRDAFWHRPWRIHSEANKRREAAEREGRPPSFEPPRHHRFKYDPLMLRDYQKREFSIERGR
jgi:radical SAM superfamily enzyme YgiQ (UPF0313 family)